MGSLRLSVFAVAAVIPLAAHASELPQEPCWDQTEVQAARVRDLQTMLMVGSLQCASAGSASEEAYNSFVRNSRPQLLDYNNVLKARFMRIHGVREGQRAYDEFTTGMANDHSSRARSKNFCGTVASFVETAGSAPQPDLEAMAEMVSEEPFGVGEACPIEAHIAAVTPLPPAATPIDPVVQPAAMTVVADPAAQAAPDPQAVTAALKAAAIAMQAAAAALQMSQSGQPVPAAAETAPPPEEMVATVGLESAAP